MAQSNDATQWRQDARDVRTPSTTESTGRASGTTPPMKRYSSATRLRRFIAGGTDSEFAGLDRLDRAELDEDDSVSPDHAC